MRISFHPAGKQIKREARRDVRSKPSDLGEIGEERERERDGGRGRTFKSEEDEERKVVCSLGRRRDLVEEAEMRVRPCT